MPLNRQASDLQENTEDLFIFKVKSFSCAGDDCWRRLQGHNTGASRLLLAGLWPAPSGSPPL